MRSLDLVEEQEVIAAKQAQEAVTANQQLREELTAVINGEHLPDDYEAVTAENGRMLSQEDVNNIVRDRLAKAKSKYAEATEDVAKKLSGYEATLTEREQKLKADEYRFEVLRKLYDYGFDADEATLKLVMSDSMSMEETLEKIHRLGAYVRPEPRDMHKISDVPKKDGLLRRIMGLHDTN